MPRELILVTRSASRLTAATTIEPGYSKGYTPDEMRMWADDLDRYYKTPPGEVARWQRTPADQLSHEQQRTLAVHDKLFTEFDRGIKGELHDDGKIELTGGRHRAGYLLERGVDPVPVWVSAPDQRQLDELRAQCNRESSQVRSGSPPRVEPPARAARAEQSRERSADRARDNNPGGDRVRA